MEISPLAGKPADPASLVNVPKLITAYYAEISDPSVPGQRVSFGTSGHRGSAFNKAFNEWHILAISQAICLYRSQHKINGPLFLGMDTHALSIPALASALEVLAANGGPAEGSLTDWIETRANEFLESGLMGVKRISLEKALHAATTHRYDYLNTYVDELAQVVDLDVIRESKINLGVDPLGGAGVHYWGPIADRYGLNLKVVNQVVDPTFRFMTVDWDGQIRMDPSSPYAMEGLTGLKDSFDIAFACDTDHDRHGIVTRSIGLLPPNHYLSVAIYYLFQHRPKWSKTAAVGKTLVSSQIIDRVTAMLNRKLYEVPVGFKWFVNGLLDGSLGFGGEESAGASFVRMDGSTWTTDKDGIILALLAAEITARMGRDPGEIYSVLTSEFGDPVYERIDAPATTEQKVILAKLSPQQVKIHDLAGEKIQAILTTAPGNDASIGGLKVVAESGWFAARPSGTEDIYKIYAESFRGADHLKRIQEEAQTIVTETLKASLQ
jgi:phosphoglucomutase